MKEAINTASSCEVHVAKRVQYCTALTVNRETPGKTGPDDTVVLPNPKKSGEKKHCDQKSFAFFDHT
jgi:hypothetical protein